MAPFYGWGSTTSRLQSHYKEAVYFLPLSSKKFPVLIWSALEEISRNITINATVEFGHKFMRTWIFTGMNFSEPFQTVASELFSYLVVRIINQMIISVFHFLFPSSNFYGFEEYLFWSLQKIKIKKEWWDIYFATPQVSGSEMFLGKFSEITRINS